ncbi:MAG: hypothetical protein IH624_05530 [Phycisphaerae bacterium]|nr:hypothetical protein [Phycisphaerae bacterium]
MEGPFKIEAKPFVTEAAEETPQEPLSGGPVAVEQPSGITGFRAAMRRYFVGD